MLAWRTVAALKRNCSALDFKILAHHLPNIIHLCRPYFILDITFVPSNENDENSRRI